MWFFAETPGGSASADWSGPVRTVQVERRDGVEELIVGGVDAVGREFRRGIALGAVHAVGAGHRLVQVDAAAVDRKQVHVGHPSRAHDRPLVVVGVAGHDRVGVGVERDGVGHVARAVLLHEQPDRADRGVRFAVLEHDLQLDYEAPAARVVGDDGAVAVLRRGLLLVPAGRVELDAATDEVVEQLLAQRVHQLLEPRLAFGRLVVRQRCLLRIGQLWVVEGNSAGLAGRRARRGRTGRRRGAGRAVGRRSAARAEQSDDGQGGDGSELQLHGVLQMGR